LPPDLSGGIINENEDGALAQITMFLFWLKPNIFLRI